jgi:hypothetical protein
MFKVFELRKKGNLQSHVATCLPNAADDYDVDNDHDDELMQIRHMAY